MPYTEEEGGRLNNYALEPRVYKSEPTTPAQKRSYMIIATVGLLLVASLMFVAFSVS